MNLQDYKAAKLKEWDENVSEIQVSTRVEPRLVNEERARQFVESTIDELIARLKKAVERVEDYRSHHDPDQLYNDLQRILGGDVSRTASQSCDAHPTAPTTTQGLCIECEAIILDR